MNDYRAIKHYSKQPYERGTLIVSDTINKHKESVQHLKTFLTANQSAKTVVVTHHAPTHASIHPDYVGDILNYAYASDLSDLILDNPQINAWCHGHIHHVNDYMVGNTRILANPRGYVGYEHTGGFDVQFGFDV
jgi:Icc-related predicted phosphoesterase